LDGVLQLFLRNPQAFKQAWIKEKALREEEAKSDNLPRVLLKTSQGPITVELFENEAPNTVANFVSLVERGFYDGVALHRVLPGFMAQGGDPKGNGSGGPGYRIPCECYQPNHRLHFRGVLSMAKEGAGGSDGHGRDTGGSQFFLTFVPATFLDGNYTVFGRVIDGLDVLAKLQRRNPDDTEAPRPDKIVEAKVLRKRPHDYKPTKMPE
jgi:cyclophilin family peptidyl-prolyl cis-trans isomerase